MRESLFEALVGLVVVAVAGFFLVFSLSQRSDASTGDSYDLIAKFDRADGQPYSLLGGSYIHIQISGMPDNMQPGSKFEYTRGSMDILGILLEAVGGLGGGESTGDTGGGSEEALP